MVAYFVARRDDSNRHPDVDRGGDRTLGRHVDYMGCRLHYPHLILTFG